MSRATPRSIRSGRSPFSVVWFDDLATLRRVTASAAVQEAQRHSGAHTCDRIRLVLEEHHIR